MLPCKSTHPQAVPDRYTQIEVEWLSSFCCVLDQLTKCVIGQKFFGTAKGICFDQGKPRSPCNTDSIWILADFSKPSPGLESNFLR